MTATIRDVAKRSGVSVSTASRALNDRIDVSKDVRARVLAAASELNYTVNLHARALKGATSKTLGVILYDTNALSFNASLMHGVHDVATPRGYSIITCNASANAEAERQAYQMLLEKRVDGVLINSVESGSEPARRLAAAGIPYVLLNRRLYDLDCDYVMVDYERGAYLAARHLLELGHRHILYQLGKPDHSPSQGRLRGYRHALQEFNVPFDPELILYCDKSTESHTYLVNQFPHLSPRPTAVMAYNDEAAIPVLKALHDLGLRVPDDVALVGHNDMHYAPFLVPPLTSIAQQIYEMGRQGTEILFQKLAWPDDRPWEPKHIICEPRLIIRASSGGPLTN